ncbi:MAG: DUF2271 domain-containing protein [Burkholderiaceae bacterium]
MTRSRLSPSLLSLALASAFAAPAASAAELALSVEIPRLNVAEYHRPYVAIWIEGKDAFAGNLAVWYDGKLRNNEGTKWLKDLRQWWRRSGRALSLPIDGLTSATRAPGKHALKFDGASSPLKDLAPGQYRIAVESAREVGGREVVYLPFDWPPQQARSTSARGEVELGELTLQTTP